MCRADPMVITMRWGHSQPVPLANFSNPHECVDWEKFTGWAKGRHVNVFQEDYLMHPGLGPSYPDGRGSALGVAHDSK